MTFLHGEIMEYAEAFNDGLKSKVYSVYEKIKELNEQIQYHTDTTGNTQTILYAKMRDYENSLKYRDNPQNFDLEPVALQEKDERPLPEGWVWVRVNADAQKIIEAPCRVYKLRAYFVKGEWEVSWCSIPIRGENGTHLIFGSIEDAIEYIEQAHVNLLRS